MLKWKVPLARVELVRTKMEGADEKKGDHINIRVVGNVGFMVNTFFLGWIGGLFQDSQEHSSPKVDGQLL